MADSHGSTPCPTGAMKPTPDAAGSAKDQLVPLPKVPFLKKLFTPPADRRRIHGAAQPKSRAKSIGTKAARSSGPVIPVVSKTPSPQPEDERSELHSTVSVKPDGEKVDIDNEGRNEPEKVQVISSEAKPETCAICLDECTEPKQLDKCGHTFCTACIDHYFHQIKPQCPCCFTIYGEIRGNQPEDGKMTYIVTKHRLPGFKSNSSGTIRIDYYFPDGTQDERHPNPGQPYYGTIRQAYLPDNHEGRHVLKLLEKAFELRQIFTVGQSRTTGQDNVVTWNDIHHKTHYCGGMENFGYPDATYLNRVQQELAAKGIE